MMQPIRRRHRLSEGVRLFRDSFDPFSRHLLPDFMFPPDQVWDLKRSKRLLERLKRLPPPILKHGCRAQWNSVALFFNLAVGDQPVGYQNTAAQDVQNWLDQGAAPATPTISEFLCNYWRTLSYGRLAFGISTPVDKNGMPIIPTINAPNGDPQDWRTLIKFCLDHVAEPAWRASGSLSIGNYRWIPSIVLVQRYPTQAQATFGDYTRTVAGNKYVIGDVTHIHYYLDFVNYQGVAPNTVRKFWGTLCHEYAHNFLEFWDLYGPQGCTGYWDLLGDNSPPSRMSEVSSAVKARVNWLAFKTVINGPVFAGRNLELLPYTTSGEAIKVVPDPKHNPAEFFLLEYRKSTGAESWRPDGALQEEGLAISHINERLKVPEVWLMRDAPYFDVEFADFSDNGGTLWTGHDRLNGILYPQPKNNWFTRYSSPNSNFYGGRPSGLSITQIRVSGGNCLFRLSINGNPRVGWTVSANDRGVKGRFTNESLSGGQEIFFRNHHDVVLLTHKEGQWLVVIRQNEWIGGWQLGSADYQTLGDLDGDGTDEIYIRSPNWAGVLKWQINRFESLTVQHDRVDGWNLGNRDREFPADLDGDGRDEVFVRSPNWAGVFEFSDNRLRLRGIHHNLIDGWNLGAADREFSGHFTQSAAMEIMIRSANYMGLLRWDTAHSKLQAVSIQKDRVGGWQLNAADRHCIGDFDGDGLDEIYIRSAKWAGVLKWVSGEFQSLWIVENHLEHIDGDAAKRIALKGTDGSYGGRFLPDRDGVLHRNNNSVAIVTWETDEMRVRHQLMSPLSGLWNLSNNDKLILGDFHRVGRDRGDPFLDYVQDNLTDAFIYNAWGTGMIGVNHAQWHPDRPNEIRQEIGLTWINPNELLFR